MRGATSEDRTRPHPSRRRPARLDDAAMQRAIERWSIEDARAHQGYPDDWPRCACGDFALDGHLTCGRAACSESEARAR